MTMKEFRAAHNMTQEQLAEKLGVSRITIARIEAGASAAKLEMVLRLIEMYGVSLGDAIKILNVKRFQDGDDA